MVPLAIELAVSGDLQPAVVGDHIELRRDSRASCSYAGLTGLGPEGKIADPHRWPCSTSASALLVYRPRCDLPNHSRPLSYQRRVTDGDRWHGERRFGTLHFGERNIRPLSAHPRETATRAQPTSSHSQQVPGRKRKSWWHPTALGRPLRNLCFREWHHVIVGAPGQNSSTGVSLHIHVGNLGTAGRANGDGWRGR